MGSGHSHWMREAISLARAAMELGEVPVGAVIVRNDEIIGRGMNRTIVDSDPTAHAEIVALRDAAIRVGNHRLTGASLYVTIEPCTMCAGALVHARIRSLYFGAREPRAGAVVSTDRIFGKENLNHRPGLAEGICAEECAALMKNFFAERRT